MFSSPIKFAEEFEVPLMRERDITLMDAFLDTGIWQIGDLVNSGEEGVDTTSFERGMMRPNIKNF